MVNRLRLRILLILSNEFDTSAETHKLADKNQSESNGRKIPKILQKKISLAR
jgi:hypothetical protein